MTTPQRSPSPRGLSPGRRWGHAKSLTSLGIFTKLLGMCVVPTVGILQARRDAGLPRCLSIAGWELGPDSMAPAASVPEAATPLTFNYLGVSPERCVWLSCWAQELRLGRERGPPGFLGAARGALLSLATPPPLRQPLVVLPGLLGQGAPLLISSFGFSH